YRSALAHITNVSLVDVPYRVGEMAGALRAQYGLPLPDMIQAAVAMQTPKPLIITNDKLMRKVREVRTVLLSEF
ncbi:MAG: PIN domain-containing protein, partial [Verrucomicrobia bacterium]|nr:PIN domain-containing protein [Verrucomicrobiota bacterium]